MLVLRKVAAIVAAGLIVSGAAHAETAKWLRADSPHFTVYSDNSETVTRTYLHRLEQYRYVLGIFHNRDAEDDANTPRMTVYFVEGLGDIRKTWPDVRSGVMGYYKACDQGSAAFAIYQDDFTTRKASSVEKQAENLSQVVLFHEYAHTFMMQNSDVKYPKWFIEGYAEFYSTIRLEGDKAEVGTASAMRAGNLINSDLLPYEDILRDKPYIHKAPGDVNRFYAQSWLLAHYILSDPARRQAFDAYLEAFDKGEDPVSAFEKAFGIPIKTLQKTLHTYMLKNLMATVYRIKDMPDSDITIAPMPVSANRLLLSDAAVRVCPSRDFGQVLLKSIETEAAKYPGEDYARMVLARAQIIVGDESQALGYLRDYTKAHPDDAESQYRLGQTLFLMTMHGHIEAGETRASQMKEARQTLYKAYKLDPLNAPNLYYYSRTLGDDGVTDNAINAAIQAHYLAPSVDEYAVRAAWLLVSRDRAEEAKEMLYPLANNPHNQDLSQWAGNILNAIDRHASKEELLKLLRGERKSEDHDETPGGDATPAKPDTPAK